MRVRFDCFLHAFLMVQFWDLYSFSVFFFKQNEDQWFSRRSDCGKRAPGSSNYILVPGFFKSHSFWTKVLEEGNKFAEAQFYWLSVDRSWHGVLSWIFWLRRFEGVSLQIFFPCRYSKNTRWVLLNSFLQFQRKESLRHPTPEEH